MYWSKDLKTAIGLPNCIGSSGVFLATMGADENRIETSFREAIRIAKEQKSASLAARAEASYAGTGAKERAWVLTHRRIE